MDKRQVELYLKRKGMDAKQRLTKDRGGQYLNNFLIEFAQDIKEKTLNDAIAKLKDMRF